MFTWKKRIFGKKFGIKHYHKKPTYSNSALLTLRLRGKNKRGNRKNVWKGVWRKTKLLKANNDTSDKNVTIWPKI